MLSPVIVVVIVAAAAVVAGMMLVLLFSRKEPTTKTAPQPVAQPVAKPVANPLANPVANPLANPVAKPVAKPVAQPVVKPVAQPVVKPVAKPVAVPSFIPGGIPCNEKNEWREPRTPQEVTLFAMLRERAIVFANHLAKKYPKDPRTRNLLRAWNGTVQVSTKRDTGATFYYNNGCLVVNPYQETVSGKVKGDWLPRTPGSQPGMDDFGRLLTRMLHEMAHSTAEGHRADFYDAQRWFLRIATEELKWPLKTSCRVCCHSTKPCAEVCPKCIWVDEGAPASCTLTDRVCDID